MRHSFSGSGGWKHCTSRRAGAEVRRRGNSDWGGRVLAGLVVWLRKRGIARLVRGGDIGMGELLSCHECRQEERWERDVCSVTAWPPSPYGGIAEQGSAQL